MWNITFCCRDAKVGKDGLAPMEMVITIDGVRSYRRLSIKVNPLEYKKLISSKRDNYVKRYCKNERLKAYDTISKLEIMGYPITIEVVKDALINGVNTNYSLTDLQKDFLLISKQRVGTDLSTPCYQRYVRITNKVIAILGNKECRTITNKDIRLLAAELLGSLQASSFANQWSIVKLFINYGINNNRILGHNLFDSIKVERKPKKVEYLTCDELNKIRSTPYSSPSLQRVADIAILQANLGLAYCDLVDIKRDDIRERGGVKFIQKQRQKTGVEYITVVNDESLEILERYNFSIIISNQAYNRFLKIVALQAGVSKSIHSHCFRHTFATLQIALGTDIYTVSKMLTHRNVKTTQIYADLVNSKKRESANRISLK